MTTVTFGEVMLRLAAPGFERFLQSPLFSDFRRRRSERGGSTREFWYPAAFVTVLPEKNALGDAVMKELRSFGVDASRIVRTKGRLGIYFLEAGANQRPSKVIYDREFSSIALAKPGQIPWDTHFRAQIGFTSLALPLAISASAADLALESVRIARKKKITVSCDLNFRKNLWKWGKPASEVMRELLTACRYRHCQ